MPFFDIPSSLSTETQQSLSDLTNDLEDSRQLLLQATETSDREEATLIVEATENEIHRIMSTCALHKGVEVSENLLEAATTKVANLNWDDGKKYSCHVLKLLWDEPTKRIMCKLSIIGYNNSSSSSKYIVPLELLEKWKPCFPETEFLLNQKCFAADPNYNNGLWSQATIIQKSSQQEEATTTFLVEFVKRNDEEKKDSSASSLPLTHLRPLTSAPSQGQFLRKKLENMNELEKAQVSQEKKEKEKQQQDKKRRQRDNKIKDFSSDWKSMRGMLK